MSSECRSLPLHRRPDSAAAVAGNPSRRLFTAGAAATGALLATRPVHAQNLTRVRIGYLPDISATSLFSAKFSGQDEALGIDIRPVEIRDLSAVPELFRTGVIDAAILPPSVAITGAYGVREESGDQLLISAHVALGGTAVTVGRRLYNDMVDADREAMTAPRPTTARALPAVLANRRAQGDRALRFGCYSETGLDTHLLRYWLADSGMNPATDIELVPMNGPLMVASLRSEGVDGIIGPDPWHSFAVAAGYGRSLITGQDIWANAPLASLTLQLRWAERNHETHKALIQALTGTSRDLESRSGRGRALGYLARETALNLPQEISARSIGGAFRYIRELEPEPTPDFVLFNRYAANFPWLSDAIWYQSQSVRWGLIDEVFDLRRVAQAVMRPDIFRDAVAEIAEPVPRQEYKSDGSNYGPYIFTDATAEFVMGPDHFIDGRQFNPAEVGAYIAGFDQHALKIDPGRFGDVNGG